MSLFTDDDEFLATNGTVDLYSTSWTELLTEHLYRRENYGYFEDAMVVDVRKHGGSETMGFAVVGKDYNNILFDFSEPYEFDFQLFMYKNRIDDERNIVNMAQAKKMKKKKVKQ